MQNYSAQEQQLGVTPEMEEEFKTLPDRLCKAVLLGAIFKNVEKRVYPVEKQAIAESLLDLLVQANPRQVERVTEDMGEIGTLVVAWFVVPKGHRPEICVKTYEQAQTVFNHYQALKQCMAICLCRLKETDPEIFTSLEALEGSPFTLRESVSSNADKATLYTYEHWEHHLGLQSWFEKRQ